MNKARLVIMAGGASSRMKNSLDTEKIDPKIRSIAQKVHKSLIPLGKTQTPLLIHLIENAKEAGYREIYIITAADNQAFKTALEAHSKRLESPKVTVFYAIQHLPPGRQKPMGTADAVLQAMAQYPELEKGSFTLCNGDNLYAASSLAQLLKPYSSPHAIVSYDRSGLDFPEERIRRFAVLLHDEEGFLSTIIEKPTAQQVATLQTANSPLYVSMNLFRFNGKLLKPYLENCRVHPERQEKELPEAVHKLVEENNQAVYGFKVSENVPDLTAAADLLNFRN